MTCLGYYLRILGLIKNVEYRRCVTAENAQENAFLKLEECDSTNQHQIWAWQDDNGLRISLLVRCVSYLKRFSL